MKKITAHLKSLRIAPRKVRLVADLIKGMDVASAEAELRTRVKRGSLPVLKLLKSAVANAHNNEKISPEVPLYVTDIRVDEGRAFKRYMPRARGRATIIKKRTSHISLVLEAGER